MKRERRVSSVVSILASCLALSACARPRTPVSGELTWTRAEAVAAAEVDEIAVAPGDVVRIASDRPVRIVSVTRGAQGEAEVATTALPKDGVVLVRPALGTSALRVPHGTVVHLGAPRSPELAWFDLESEALAWSRSPLGTTFPALATAPRIDTAEIGEIDAALVVARGGSRDLARADASIAAVRSVVALRAVHALEGFRPYPYARNVELSFATPPTSTRDIDEKKFAELLPGKPLTLTIEGPTSLAVASRVLRGADVDVVAELRVAERGHVRGASRATIQHIVPEDPKAPAVKPPVDDETDPTLATLRRVFVHVPPGRHTYEIAISGAPAWIAASDTSAYARVEDAFTGAKSEGRFITEAKRACEAPALDGACAIALALAGEDDGPRFEQAMAAGPPLAQRLARQLGSGAPADRAAGLESGAATGDNAAVAALGRDAAETIDASLRDAWWRGTARGTSWQTIDNGAEPTWFAFLPREAAIAACAVAGTARPAPPRPSEAGSAPEREMDAQPLTVFAAPWRRAHAVRFLAVTPCAQAAPMQLEVDGEVVSAQPGSGRAVWHVVVRGETARVRRVDTGPGHVYALSDDACGGHGTLVHSATPLGDLTAAPGSTKRDALTFPASTSAPGVEIWLADGTPAASFALASQDGRERLEVTARAGAGLVAIDEKGARWRRAATVALPPWALSGARATGAAVVALRPVARGVRSELDVKAIEHAQKPSVEALVSVSRELLAAKTPDARRAAALRRALLLATFGAERAALEDAELAKGYGAQGAVEDPIAVVRRAILPLPPTPLDMTSAAYGIESDFDPKAARCAPSAEGPRARIAALDAALRQRAKNAPLDRSLAGQAAALASASPHDPRVATLVTLATSGSKWKLLRDVEGGGGRVPRPHEKDANPVLDADGRLRARLHAGDPFGSSFVSVSPARPARAFLGDIGAAKARLDIVCVARRPDASGERCPLEVRMGEQAVPSRIGEDGRATIELPHGRGRGKGAELEVALTPSRADYVALVRIVLDAQSPGTTQVTGVGWVLDTPHIQYRFLLPPGRPIRVRQSVAGLVRIDAVAEPGSTADVVCVASGHETVLPADGEPRIIPVPAGGEVVVTSRSGTATVAIAERIESDSKTPEGDFDARGASVRQLDTTSARADVTEGAWRAVADSSPRPLSWLEDRLGTLEAHSGGVAGTLREGARSDTALDAFAFESLTYRRRIESLNLFTLASGLVRIRDGEPTYGGALSLYESIESIHLRIGGTAGAFAQDVAGESRYTVRPRAFVEYSGRISSDFFLLPRVGYDGYYTTLPGRPASSRSVDDDVYNGFRFQRNTLAYLQGLLWYVPFFNDIFYVRLRGTYDASNGAFSHASVKPGTFLILGAVELAANVDVQYFERTTGARATSGVDATAGGGVSLHLPISSGFELRPNTTGTVRADGGWQVLAGVALIASYRRGARDYAAVERAYPEEVSGGVPWRTESRAP